MLYKTTTASHIVLNFKNGVRMLKIVLKHSDKQAGLQCKSVPSQRKTPLFKCITSEHLLWQTNMFCQKQFLQVYPLTSELLLTPGSAWWLGEDESLENKQSRVET